jgi:hypothetical protein
VQRRGSGRLRISIVGDAGDEQATVADFTDEAARRFAVEILRRTPGTAAAAILAAGWTGAHHCETGDLDCVHLECARCEATEMIFEGANYPAHLCAKAGAPAGPGRPRPGRGRL